MITAYHRPKTLDEAIALLSKPNTQPLGGGTMLSRAQGESTEAVDLQALGLNTFQRKGNDFEIGATLTLQSLLENESCPEALKTAIKLEAPINLRNTATIAGTLVAADGRSTFATALLALDAKITVISGQTNVVGIGEYLLAHPKGLITQISIPANINFAFEYVSKTPSDTPLVCAALAQWTSGRARLALGGYGKTPALAMDGTESNGIESAARNAYHEAQDDFASAEYRSEIAAVLAKRCAAGK